MRMLVMRALFRVLMMRILVMSSWCRWIGSVTGGLSLFLLMRALFQVLMMRMLVITVGRFYGWGFDGWGVSTAPQNKDFNHAMHAVIGPIMNKKQSRKSSAGEGKAEEAKQEGFSRGRHSLSGKSPPLPHSFNYIKKVSP